MLTRLIIHNYALIRELQVDFESGFNIITGETGAGKSILLGALGLILGNRADLQILRDENKKCVIEGHFEIEKYSLSSFFENHNIDYEALTIVRREIIPSGKSRAFINDTPVNLDLLKAFATQLIDIHSQHQNLDLSDNQFQLKVIDDVAGLKDELSAYSVLLKDYNETAEALKKVVLLSEKSKADLDYHVFQFNQLNDARLSEHEQDDLEQELRKLTHAEEIRNTLNEVSDLLDNEQVSVINQVREASKKISRITEYLPDTGSLSQRIESCYHELKDISGEVNAFSESTGHDPDRIGQVNDRLALIYSLEQKHRAGTVSELIQLRESFRTKINQSEEFDETISALEKMLVIRKEELLKTSAILSKKRSGIFESVRKKTEATLQLLGMPGARFQVRHTRLENFTPSGLDKVEFLFSANRDTEPGEISRIASGGEISRLMLAIKALISASRMLPTIVFDEIDSGISGETAFKMAAILRELSLSAQIINITHLPQIAGKGDSHYLVYKTDEDNGTATKIRRLSDQERIAEIARMVSGDQVSDSAIDTALELIRRS